MRMIYKYVMSDGKEDRNGNYVFDLPKGAKILSVAFQRSRLVFWADFDASCKNELESRSLFIVGTGIPYEKDAGKLIPVGTAITEGGDFVFHLFERVDDNY